MGGVRVHVAAVWWAAGRAECGGGAGMRRPRERHPMADAADRDGSMVLVPVLLLQRVALQPSADGSYARARRGSVWRRGHRQGRRRDGEEGEGGPRGASSLRSPPRDDQQPAPTTAPLAPCHSNLSCVRACGGVTSGLPLATLPSRAAVAGLPACSHPLAPPVPVPGVLNWPIAARS